MRGAAEISDPPDAVLARVEIREARKPKIRNLLEAITIQAHLAKRRVRPRARRTRARSRSRPVARFSETLRQTHDPVIRRHEDAQQRAPLEALEVRHARVRNVQFEQVWKFGCFRQRRHAARAERIPRQMQLRERRGEARGGEFRGERRRAEPARPRGERLERRRRLGEVIEGPKRISVERERAKLAKAPGDESGDANRVVSRGETTEERQTLESVERVEGVDVQHERAESRAEIRKRGDVAHVFGGEVEATSVARRGGAAVRLHRRRRERRPRGGCGSRGCRPRGLGCRLGCRVIRRVGGGDVRERASLRVSHQRGDFRLHASTTRFGGGQRGGGHASRPHPRARDAAAASAAPSLSSFHPCARAPPSASVNSLAGPGLPSKSCSAHSSSPEY